MPEVRDGFGVRVPWLRQVSKRSWPCWLYAGHSGTADVCFLVYVFVYVLVPPLEAEINLLLASQGCLLCVCVSFIPQTIEFDESAGAVLRIQPLRTPRDENIYECVAQNPHGEVTVHAKLTVLRGKEHFCLPCVSVTGEGTRQILSSFSWVGRLSQNAWPERRVLFWFVLTYQICLLLLLNFLLHKMAV